MAFARGSGCQQRGQQCARCAKCFVWTAGIGLNEIARRVGVAPSTVRLTLKRLANAGFSWPLPAEMTDSALEAALFAAVGTKQGHRGWVELEFEDGSSCRLEAGDSCFIPGGMHHNEIRTSDDLEILEVCLPANMGTVPVEPPAARPNGS